MTANKEDVVLKNPVLIIRVLDLVRILVFETYSFFGSWFLVLGAYNLFGSWFLVLGAYNLFGSWFLLLGAYDLFGSWFLEFGFFKSYLCITYAAKHLRHYLCPGHPTWQFGYSSFKGFR